jgi:hypothetical protein
MFCGQVAFIKDRAWGTMALAIRSGKKPEDFLIASAVASKTNGGKKTRKAKRFAKK